MNEWMTVTEIFLKLENNIDKLEQYILECTASEIIPDRNEILKKLRESRKIALQGEDYSKENWM